MKTRNNTYSSFWPIVIFILIIPIFNANSYAQHRKAHKKKVVKANVIHSKKVAHHRYSHLPKRGAAFKVLHKNTKIIMYNGKKYHFHNGVYYHARGAKYIVVAPPRGIKIKHLPTGYKRIRHNGSMVFYYYGSYYRNVNNNQEFETIDPPVGAQVEDLPEGYQTTIVDGVEYHTLDDVKYKTTQSSEGHEVYEVVQ